MNDASFHKATHAERPAGGNAHEHGKLGTALLLEDSGLLVEFFNENLDIVSCSAPSIADAPPSPR